MVDYSKFDTLAAELSDDDEAQGRRPVVTRLQAGSQVTIGRTGAVVSEPGPLAPSARPKAANLPHAVVDYSRWDKFTGGDSSEEDFEYDDGDEGGELRGGDEAAAGRVPPTPPEAPSARPSAPSVEFVPEAGRRGSRVADLSRNGAVVGDSHLWSQSASEVTLSVIVPPDTRAKDVAVQLTRPPGPPGGEHHRVTVTVHGACLVDHHLAFAIQLPDATSDAAAAEDIDWAVEDLDEASPPAAAAAAAAEGGDWPRRRPRRLVRITLRKAGIPGASDTGMVLWWNRCLKEHPGEAEPIDTAGLVDRQPTAERNQQARQAWAEAQAMFLERVKDPQRRIVVD